MRLPGPSFVWLSFAMITGVMATALASPLYGLYREHWQLQASDISLVYVIYMGGALCGLLLLGRLPDRIGFLRVMRWGMALGMLGTALCLAAPGMATLSAGRFLVGVSSSMLTTSSLAGLALVSDPAHARRTATLSSFLMALGFGLGPLVGGVFGQWVPWPLRTSYIPTLLLMAVGLVALFHLPLPAHVRLPSVRLQLADVLPKMTAPPAGDLGAFALVCCLPLLGFAVFGLYAAMSPLFLANLLPWHGPIVAGLAIALILFASAIVQVLSSRLPTHRCGAAGFFALAASNALLILNLARPSSALFALGVTLTAIGHGMCMVSGITMVSRIARPEQRSGLLSSYLVVGYLGSMVPMLGIGWIADRWGMDVAVTVFCATVCMAGSVIGLLFFRHRRMRPDSAGTGPDRTTPLTEG